MAKRGDVAAVKWLLDHGADPNARWAALGRRRDAAAPCRLAGHADVVRLLLAAGADPSIRDSKHDSDAIGWAEFFGQPEIVQILKAHAANTRTKQCEDRNRRAHGWRRFVRLLLFVDPSVRELRSPFGITSVVLEKTYFSVEDLTHAIPW